ncbi:unnamed protein product [Dovyalis caffra]|uniref:Uncharacterized protein n=1 Tax=Dovyalis caffra TaxID=77055 RepID=A0AAV1S0E0_9ROSI|nr:unnamed protein product [Dovyalis caffra]
MDVTVGKGNEKVMSGESAARAKEELEEARGMDLEEGCLRTKAQDLCCPWRVGRWGKAKRTRRILVSYVACEETQAPAV